MNKVVFFLVLVIFCIPSAASAQHNPAECSHIRSFQKSLISDTLDALSYEIHLNEVNTSTKTINANTKVLLASKIDNLQNITLELLDLTVDQVLVNGTATTFQHESPWLRIPLSTPINSGTQIEVEVFYQGTPFHEDWGGFHWSGEYAFNLGVGFVSNPHNLGKAWFPCIDDFHDRALYEIFVTVDNSKKAVCGGTLLEVIDNGNGTSTYDWKLRDGIPTYLASVAVGAYENVPSSFESISGETIPIGIWVRPIDTAKVEESFATLVPVLEAYETYFGPYAILLNK